MDGPYRNSKTIKFSALCGQCQQGSCHVRYEFRARGNEKSSVFRNVDQASGEFVQHGDTPEIARPVSPSAQEEWSTEDACSGIFLRSRPQVQRASSATPSSLARAGERESQREFPVPAARARACAKMLCRSGLRCACHFGLAQDCPMSRLEPAVIACIEGTVTQEVST